ncbi:hypothetical protein [Rhizobium laguerreae]|nr:hypothetical protein [Rhizobium laguerreae]MBY3434864.1 hypothetical protein [Rhizobium laguerreae]MBY3449006.1 hypothetical protein [Rhizobium laguerreae]MBY3456780.1 hypothetical protein [Rhizobium laguerreae]
MANNTPVHADATQHATLHGGPPDGWPDPFSWWPVAIAVVIIIAALYL